VEQNNKGALGIPCLCDADAHLFVAGLRDKFTDDVETLASR
jgi:hypothetical protein